MNGWIKTYRKLMGWGWYKDKYMFHLFSHLIMKANHQEKTWKKRIIRRGQLATGRKTLSTETGIPEQSIRTCLSNLQITREITIEATKSFSLITICNYETYQEQKQKSPQVTNQDSNQQINQPTNHKQEVKKKRKELFARFWETYQKKNGRKESFEKWMKMSDKDTEAAFDGVEQYVRNTPDPKYRKDPIRYLRHRIWENETPVIKKHDPCDPTVVQL